MSITVRLWSDEDLEKIKSGKDRKLATVFMNVTTFSAREIAAYPYRLRKEYGVVLEGMGEDEMPITVYATDVDTAKWFISQEYNSPIEVMWEVVTKVRTIPPNKSSRRGRASARKQSSLGASVRGLR